MTIEKGDSRMPKKPRANAKSTADKYYGIVHAKEWPEDLDQYGREKIEKRWKQHYYLEVT
ncbi:MAG: hypothetical protein NWE93_01030 [Candidatus Bathyarchaeota archaeon]|nr:hypothetical protein [Candidatus Bathyarchaeota archaeon]